MNQLYSALYDLLCYLTEDAVAHKLHNNGFPERAIELMNQLAVVLGNYLDSQE